MQYDLLIQLGIGGAILYVLWDQLKRTDRRIDARDQAFVHFVDEHNDALGKLVVESTHAIRQSTEAIKETSLLIASISKKITNGVELYRKKRRKK